MVELRGLEAAIAMLPEETAPIDLASTDDYGVKRAHAGVADAPRHLAGWIAPGPLHEIKLADGQPQARERSAAITISAPRCSQIQPDTTILVRGLAIDYFPDRQPSSTPIYRIHVLSREEHARLIHDEFEKLLEQLEEP